VVRDLECTEERHYETMRPGSSVFTILVWAALLAAVALEIAGLRTSHIFQQEVWSPRGLQRFLWYGLVFTGLGVWGVFARRYFALVVLGAVVLGTWIAVGPVALGAALLFVFSATVLGKLVFGRELEGPVAFLAGAAVWILVLSCLIRVPIQYAAVYLVLLALPAAMGFTVARRLAGDWLHLLRPAWTPTLPEYVAAFLVALVGGAHWLVVLKPEASYDGLAMHMAAAANIAIHHAFTIDFRQFVWALMPMGADWCYAVAYVLGGEYAARLLNLAVLAVIGLLVFGVARRWVSTATAALVVFLFLSTPMVQLVTGSLLVENFVAAMSLGAAVALWKFQEKATARLLMLTAFLLGTSVAMKLGAVAVAVVILPFFIATMWRQRGQFDRKILVGAVAVLIVSAGVPYVNAYVRSGDPIFPFENARFHSPYYANENIKDARYREPLTWSMPFRLTFGTSHYYEAQDGSFGFQYLLFLPLTLVCLASIKSYAGRSAAIIGLGGGLIIAIALPNARYFYPVLPFLTLGATAAVAGLAVQHGSLFRASVLAALMAGLLNTYLLPASGWLHKDFFSTPLFSKRGRREYLLSQAPVRELIGYINGVDRIAPVAFLDSSTFAGLMAPAYARNWHDYKFWEQVEEIQDPQDLYRLFTGLGVHRVIVESTSERGAIIKTVLDTCTQQEYSVAGNSILRLKADCEIKPPHLAPLSAGTYDETDPGIALEGNWTRMQDLPFAYQHTEAYTSRAGANIRFLMVGRGFRYTYAGAYNRGMAEILVDGKRERVVDLYDPKVVWQAQVTITGLAPGMHDIAIRALGQQNAGANGHYVDIDSIEVLR